MKPNPINKISSTTYTLVDVVNYLLENSVVGDGGGVPAILSGPDSQRPDPADAGTLFISQTDNGIYQFRGGAWVRVGGLASIDWTSVTNKPNASASTSGILTSSDWSLFNAKEDANKKGVAGGYAGLDSNAKVPINQLPSLDFNKTYVVADIAARDALTNLRSGDRAIVLDAGDGSREGYVWDGSDWLKDSDTDWANVVLEWVNLVGGPTSTPAQLDSAVSHSTSTGNPHNTTPADIGAATAIALQSLTDGSLVARGTVGSGTNLNLLKEPGVWSTGLNAELINGPGMDYCVLIVTTAEDTRTIQVAVGVGTTKMKFRACNATDNWMSWAELETVAGVGPKIAAAQGAAQTFATQEADRAITSSNQYTDDVIEAVNDNMGKTTWVAPDSYTPIQVSFSFVGTRTFTVTDSGTKGVWSSSITTAFADQLSDLRAITITVSPTPGGMDYIRQVAHAVNSSGVTVEYVRSYRASGQWSGWSKLAENTDNWQKYKLTEASGLCISLPVSTDLNNVRLNGSYMGYQLTNAPDADWWYIEVLAHNNSYCLQKAYKLNRGVASFYIRTYENSVWQPWSADVFQSGVDAKNGAVASLIAQGVSAAASDTWSTINSRIRQIQRFYRYRTPLQTFAASETKIIYAPSDMLRCYNMYVEYGVNVGAYAVWNEGGAANFRTSNPDSNTTTTRFTVGDVNAGIGTTPYIQLTNRVAAQAQVYVVFVGYKNG